jgi:hypothetical protein
VRKRLKKFSKLFGSKSSLSIGLAVIFGVWVLYRLVVRAPLWVDEIFVKAIVFGLPAWAYACSIKNNHNVMGFSNDLFWKGMFSVYSAVSMNLLCLAYMARGTTFMRYTSLLHQFFSSRFSWR